MGIGPTAVRIYRQLAEQGLLRAAMTVLELGAQEVVVHRSPAALADIAELFRLLDAGPACAVEKRWPARLLMQALGLTYRSIDSNGQHGALPLDLNDEQWVGQYDLVTNHGTSEHVFDQRAVFRTVHESCKVGGVMLHVVPSAGYPEHGFYLYQPPLFHDLARANGYEVLALVTSADETYPGGELLAVALRKVAGAPFVVPRLQEKYRTQ